MKHIAPTITEHRKTRLLAWARLLLFWVGALMFRDSLGRISERHLLARGFYANLDAVARTINNIIVLHASAKLGRGTGHPPKLRKYASSGFFRRTRVRSITRAGRGSWLRERLQHRGRGRPRSKQKSPRRGSILRGLFQPVDLAR